ncbi:MAG: hypothetical protein D6768_01655 [Chloroflexi bacterium]|nr:MAG: hypothetical protein D6768_01655 [Chloroflexota bacterium]
MTTNIFGACPHDCPDTCGIVTTVKNGRAVSISGTPDHPVTGGWLCAKVRPYLNHVYHPERLTTPLRRTGPKGSGQFTPISWDEALAEITERWQEIIQQYGAEAILPYSYSGTLGLVQMSVASSRFWNRLGASQLERSICGAAAEYAVEITFGVRHSPPYADVEQSKLVILWGNNAASSGPHFLPHLEKARRSGAEVIVIDPRRTRTARRASLHLAPLPGRLEELNTLTKRMGLGDEWLTDWKLAPSQLESATDKVVDTRLEPLPEEEVKKTVRPGTTVEFQVHPTVKREVLDQYRKERGIKEDD